MKRIGLLIFLFLLCFTHSGRAQATYIYPNGDVLVAGQQVAVKMRTSGNSINGYIYLPAGYDSTQAKRYALICYYHGMGGNGAPGNAVSDQGLANAISKGIIPYSSTTPGDTTWFIIYTVAGDYMGVGGSYAQIPIDYHFLLDYYRLRIDTTKVYATGLSAGGEQTTVALIQDSTIFTAGIPMSTNYINLPTGMSLDQDVRPFWQLHGKYDNTVPFAGVRSALIAYNASHPNNQVLLTAYDGGHGDWNTYYNPTWKWTNHDPLDIGGPNEMSVYDWLLQFRKNYPISYSVHQPPVANAGSDQTITLPVDSVLLDGSASSDPDGKIVSYKWVQLSGPSASVIKKDISAKTEVTGLDTGVYVFTLTVTDDSGATSSANVTITVKDSVVTPPPVHQPPVANAGSNQTITLPVDSVLLDGSASVDSDGKIVSYQWAQQSGPSTAAIASATLVKTKVSGLDTGVYVFTLTVKDDSGASASANVTITVKDSTVPLPPVHQPPVANAGSNQTVTLPADSVLLDGSASSDPDGKIVSYKWVQLSGPSASVIKKDTSAKTEVTGLDTGVYVFTLTVADDSGATSSTNVTITVKDSTVPLPPVHQPPVASAGGNQVITLPVDSVLLDGSASSDPDGAIVSYKWVQLSGPSTSVIKKDTSAKTEATGLDTGVYVFTLTVKDDSGASASANVTITVKDSVITPPVHQAPVANAGSNQTITLPVDSVLLDGSASYDSGGTIVSYLWSQQSGPAPFTFSKADSVKTEVNLPVPGAYVFTLTVTNNAGYTDTSHVTVTVTGTYNGLPVANAGNDTTIYYPLSFVYLNGSKSYTNGGILYSWKQVSGPASDIIKNTTRAYTKVEDLVPGVYVFQLTVRDYGQNSDSAKVTVTVLPDPTQPGDVSYTANTYVSPYNQPFQYGTNPGTYSGWNDTSIAGVALYAGAHSLRATLPDYFVQRFGYDIRLNEFNYYTRQLGMKEITLFVGQPSSGDADDSTYAPATSSSDVFKNLYSPIWDSGQNGTPINDTNYFAVYIYNLVKMYGKNIRFWEIVNEADATGFWDNGNTLRSGNWWITAPGPASLLNIKAPVYYYIRMLRIAYEVIKKFYPDEYISTGGIGYPAFLDALLRYTDNPDNGKVTPEYPLKGGAYFDVVSFHAYPAYNLQVWENSIGGFRWHRYSDYAASAIINLKSTFDSVLNNHGYNGIEYPSKPFILTETNLPREAFGAYFGSDSAQYDFIIKSLVKSQQYGIRQFYIYQLGETSNYGAATDPYELMGLYQNLNGTPYGQQKLTDEGKAYKTTSMLLYGWQYDSVRTAALNLPAGVDGAAFRQDTSYRYVLWAVTHTDLSEVANATYSFPAALKIDSVYQYEWDYSVNPGDTGHLSSQNIALTGTPAFFTVSKLPDTLHVPPVADAGKNQTISLPVSSVTLDGSASYDTDGTIISYKWKQASGPGTAIIADSNSVKTQVTGLAAGVYTFTLTVTDNKGATSSDNVIITVNATTNVMPIANAGQNQTITLPLDSVLLDGSASYDPYGKIGTYKWTLNSGPSSFFFSNADSAKTIVSKLVAGTYIFTLTVTDTGGAYASANVTVYVNAHPHQPPVANAGSNMTIQLPQDSVILDGSKSTASGGTIVTYWWNQVSGPQNAVFGPPTNNGAVVQANNLIAGTYVLSLTVTDNQGASDTSTVTVIVKPANNIPPVANAGNNVNIFLPADSTILDGSASYDPDGKIVSWSWAQTSGPSAANIAQAGSALTQVSNLANGTYIFTLTVADNEGAQDTASVTIGVYKPADQPPVANAGKDITIVLPQNTVTLDGSASNDPGGTIVTWHWDPMTGPTQAKILNPDASTTVVTGLQMGTYDFRLTVTDNKGLSSTATVSVYVMPARDTMVTTFRIYPNPVHNMLHVELNKSITGILEFRIIDVNGRILKVYQFGQLPMHVTKVLDVSGLTPGIYFIQLIEDNQLRDVKKMIKY